MRDILFRGKRKDNGEWVEGNGIDFTHRTPYILTTEKDVLGYGFKEFAVIPETVGQYTGLTDKNGKKIFEDDIVDIRIGGLKKRGWVFYGNRAARWGVVLEDSTENYSFLQQNLIAMYDIVVVGNFCDNPELLKGGV